MQQCELPTVCLPALKTTDLQLKTLVGNGQWPMANDNTNCMNLSNGMAARPAGWEAPPPIVAEITTRWALGKPLRRKAQSMSRVKGTS